MKKTTILISGMLATALLFTTASCKKKDKEEEVAPENGPYVLAVTAEGSSSEATDYILQTSDLMTGVISPVGKGIEQKSYRMYELVGPTLLSITYQASNIVPGYEMDGGHILKKKSGEFSIMSLHARNAIDDDRMLGMYVPRNGTKEATFYEINAKTMSVVKEAKVNVYEAAGNGIEQAYFNDLKLVGNKVYAPFFQIKNNSFETAFGDSAYIAIYSYPELKLEKVIKDDRTGPIGAYATNDAMSITENGDIYTYSPTAIASGSAPTAKPSGILRIKSGTTEFDKSYFFNIEEVTGGYKIACMRYVGNGKALAQIYSFKTHVSTDKWTTRDCRLAIIDLNAKTVNYVDGVPLHTGGLNYKSLLDGGNAYLQVKNGDGVFIYRVDLATGKGFKGAQIQGKAVMGFFKM